MITKFWKYLFIAFVAGHVIYFYIIVPVRDWRAWRTAMDQSLAIAERRLSNIGEALMAKHPDLRQSRQPPLAPPVEEPPAKEEIQ